MKNLYNTTEAEGVHKWMRELNVDVGFETKKMKMERTRMLSLEGYHRRLVVSINGGSTINVSPRKIVINKSYKFFNFFQFFFTFPFCEKEPI